MEIKQIINTMYETLKGSWKFLLLALIVLIILITLIRIKKRKYFWKIKKTGEELKFKDFMKRWKSGVEGITSIQIVRTNLWGNRIIILGITLGMLVNFIVRMKNNWWWIEIILAGSLILTIVQWVTLKKKYWKLKEVEDTTRELEKGEYKIQNEIHGLDMLSNEKIKDKSRKKDGIIYGIIYDEGSNISEDDLKKLPKIDIDKLIRESLDKDKDVVIAIDGKERVGMSSMAEEIGKYSDEKIKKKKEKGE